MLVCGHGKTHASSLDSSSMQRQQQFFQGKTSHHDLVWIYSCRSYKDPGYPSPAINSLRVYAIEYPGAAGEGTFKTKALYACEKHQSSFHKQNACFHCISAQAGEGGKHISPHPRFSVGNLSLKHSLQSKTRCGDSFSPYLTLHKRHLKMQWSCSSSTWAALLYAWCLQHFT